MKLKPQDNQLKRAICQLHGEQVFHDTPGEIDVYALKPITALAEMKAGITIIVHQGVEHVRAKVVAVEDGFWWQNGDYVGSLAFENGQWLTTSQGEVISADSGTV